MKKEEYYPSIKGSIGLLLVYDLLCPIIPLILLDIICSLIGVPNEHPIIDSIGSIGTFALLVLWINRKYNVDYKSIFSLQNISIIYIIPICLSTLGLSILLTEVDNILRMVLPLNDYWKNIFEGFSGERYGFFSTFISISIVAPIIEEFLIRGIILRGFLTKYSVKKSIVISALIFGIMHMNPWQFVSAFAAGILLGWLYLKTRSIVPCILAHAFNNSLGFIITATGLNIPGFSNDINIVEHQPIWFDLLGIVILVVGITWLIKLFNEQKSELEKSDLELNNSY